MTAITVQVTLNASIAKVWSCWTESEHIMLWNFASDDWCCPWAKNDPRTGGAFSARMQSKDGKHGFDFVGVYDLVEPQKRIIYHMEDRRKVDVLFQKQGDKTQVIETFDAESENSEELQRQGWQNIMDNFKKHVENCQVKTG